MPSYRMNGGQGGRRGQPKTEGINHPNGVTIHYFLKDTVKAVASMEILETNGTLIKKFANKPDKKAKEGQLTIKPGMNKFNWNMRYADAEGFDGLIMWSGSLTGPKAVPGMYKARLTINGTATETEFEILKDPRTSSTVADIKTQFDFAIGVRDKLSETNKAVKNIRTVRDQINRVTEPMKGKADMKEVSEMAKSILDDMKKIEETLYQTKNKSGQDPLNYPVRLNDKLAGLGSEVDGGDYRPTQQAKAVYTEVTEKINEQLNALKKVMTDKVPKFNELVKQKEVSAVSLEVM
ncbi:MAG: hypothetical protein JJE09_12730 [Bacteroidia bacterium]|nr:hypothetical protein [Bacteroidia bacterium]